MSRYTVRDLEAEVAAVNVTMRHIGDREYKVGNSYERTELHEVISAGGAIRRIETGSPRECVAALYRDAYHKVVEALATTEGEK